MSIRAKVRFAFLGIFLPIFLSLPACNFQASRTPTPDLGKELTAAVETVYSDITKTAEVVALSVTETVTETDLPPTETPIPFTATPSLTFTPFFSLTPTITLTPSPVPRSNCLKAEVTQQSLSAGPNVTQGQFLIKRWTVLNIGTCTWTTGFTIVYYDGTKFQPLPLVKNFHQVVAPGDFFIITFEFKAPTDVGIHKSYWMLRDETGQLFGIGTADIPLYIELDVQKAPN